MEEYIRIITNDVLTGEMITSTWKFVQIQAMLNVLRVIVVFLLIFIRIFYFHKEARKKIIEPLENLLDKIWEMAKNPSKAL